MSAELPAVCDATRCETGRVRPSNQDAHGSFARPGARLFVVADGMGGHRGGETASAMAVEAIGASFANGGAAGPDPTLRRAIEDANRRIYQRAAAEPALSGMGTTVVALLLDASAGAWLAHVGDSRAYRLRGDDFAALTDDHTLVNELVRKGYLRPDEAERHPQRHTLTRSVGPEPHVEIDVAHIETLPGDRLLLCSDGLCGYVDAEEIAGALGAETPQAAADALVKLADAAGGQDNVTVQVVEIEG